MATVKDGFTAIQTAKADFLDGKEITSETANLVGQAIVGDLNLRDYFLGLPSEMSLQNCVDFVEALIYATDEQYLHAHYTVLSAYRYELGETDVSYLALMTAKSLRPDYSLIGLLERVFQAGWAKESFATMRGDLHTKVLSVIEETNDRELVLATN